MNITEILESRRNPDVNVKSPTSKILSGYIQKYGHNGVFVHFNNIEKVGINFKSQNTFGPIGVYAMPVGISIDYGMKQAKLNGAKYANILLPTYKNLLDFNTIDISVMQHLVSKALAFHKKKLKNNSEFYKTFEIKNSNKECWTQIERLLYDYTRRRGKLLKNIENIFLRNNGFDAVYDNQSVINDNPDQIIFLAPGTFKVEETIPVRFE